MLKVAWGDGFFSCSTQTLVAILKYFNENKELPTELDTSSQYTWYKRPTDGDITFTYFKPYDTFNIEYTSDVNITYENREDQFSNYKHLQFKNLKPFITKYFSPSDIILSHIQEIEEKYYIKDYTNMCVLFYRGNDKVRETPICTYEEVIKKAYHVLSENLNVRFLIQSDETEFIERMLHEFPNRSFYLNDHIRHITKSNTTVDKIYESSNYMFSQYYLAITLIMSKCKYVVCGSGNCSLWIVLFRGNAENTYQFLNDGWV